MEKVEFVSDGETLSFYVLEQTKIAGISYLLVTDQEDGDSDAFILKDMSEDDAEENIYEMVSNEDELNAVAGVFENMLEDIVFVDEVEE